MYETINSSVNYGGLELKNRIIFAPTTFGLSDEEYFEKIRRIAAGGCAMVIIGDVPAGKSMIEKSLFDKKGFAYYQKLTEIVTATTAVSARSCTSRIPTCLPCSSMCPAC